MKKATRTRYDGWQPKETNEGALLWPPARETVSIYGDGVVERWENRLNTEYPEVVGQLMWDTPRIRRLEQVVENIIVADPPTNVGDVPLYRQSLINRVTGLGPLESLLADEDVSEIMVNGARSVYCEINGHLEPRALDFIDNNEVLALAQRLAYRAGRELNTEKPLCDAVLSDGSRIHCVIPPVSEEPTMTIRRAKKKLPTLENYLQWNSLSMNLWEDLKWMIHARMNIVVAGGAGTGKTSLLRLLASTISENERVVTIEDTRELNLDHAHTVSLEAHRRHTVHQLLINALRMRPDRIIVGEVRGEEALELLEAMGTGHPGSLSTIHSASGGLNTLHRLARLCLHSQIGLPYDALFEQIRDTVDVIVYIRRDAIGHRYVESITQVTPEDLTVLWVYKNGQFVRTEAGERWRD